MMVGNAHRTRVVIQPLIERAHLRRAVLFADRAAPHREHAAAVSAPRLENLAEIAELSEFVGDGQAGESRSEDDDVNAGDLTAKLESLLPGRGEKAEGGHRLVRHGRAVRRGDALEDLSSRQPQDAAAYCRTGVASMPTRRTGPDRRLPADQ
jgi:hypothetical protein